MSRREGPVVTIDGPAGAGKSTTAREVAHRLRFRHLDSGALYRALTFALLDAGVPEERWPSLSVRELAGLGVRLDARPDRFAACLGTRVLDHELRSGAVTSRVSRLARLPAARASLLELQRQAGEVGRLVADGRDMGTVVFPDAEVKVYLSADLAERARRRLRDEGHEAPTAEELSAQMAAIAERDRTDSEREASPLRRPPDAHEIDTTRLGFEEQVAAIVALVERVRPG